MYIYVYIYVHIYKSVFVFPLRLPLQGRHADGFNISEVLADGLGRAAVATGGLALQEGRQRWGEGSWDWAALFHESGASQMVPCLSVAVNFQFRVEKNST